MATRPRGGPQRIPRPDGARPGGPPPWRDVAVVDTAITAIEAALTTGARADSTNLPRPEDPTRRRSAVLIPIYETEGETWIVFTRRASHMRSHSLEVSFPGGAVDPGDTDLWFTARREAHEEIGLDPSLPRRIGHLDPFTTVGSGSWVTPIVGALPGTPILRASPDEVEHVLHVRLDDLMRPDVYREEIWPIAGMDRPVTFFELVGDTIWGATAAMLRQLLTLVSAGHPEAHPQ